MQKLWEKAKTALKKSVPVHTYKMWIEPVDFKKSEEGKIVLACPNFFSKKRVQDHYGALIESEINKISKKPCKLLIEISEKKEAVKKKKSKKSDKSDKSDKLEPDLQLTLPTANPPESRGRLLRRDFTLDRFVVSNNNDFAYSAALSLASREDPNQNSLYLLSDTGMGKSHLSQAIGHYILSKRPFDRVYYATAEDFMNEMVHAFRTNSVDQFKEKYRNHCDVLLLEDIQFLTGKERTQIELALALDYLLNADKKIIFTSCYLPTDIPKMNEQLKSRISSSLISNIDPPDFRTRVKILQKKARENGYKMPRDITDYLASELSDNVRQLESGLIGVTAKSSLLGRPIDIGLAESVVKNITVNRPRPTVTIDLIKELVCRHYNLSIDEIISRSRKKSIVWPRQMAIYLSRKYTEQPLQFIGKNFNRYHATVLHSVAAVEKGLKGDSSVRKQMEYLCGKLEAEKL
ncbi:chromosomal replication initiator protein DnaA [Desulfonema magnum]|uniref:Chromosomal replication initiator protein DnaA n=1 Tax=Desulfonema magnum TaxID=45655 RepID=A0A975BWU1_9BACT|nr:chromosomal replication initiator protein DnaA [Desulfonema magnum]QTA93143.1 Chromosomal replication initiator protein [Desulfonema magnum]